MKMKQKNTGSRELKNLQPSPIEDEDENDDDFRDITSPYPGLPKDYVYPQKDCTEDYRCQNLECSQIALDYYNKRNRTNYELVEPMRSSVFSFFPIWMHLNFTAKPKSAPDDGDDNSSTKLFFGELFHKPGQWVVNKCLILKAKSGHCDFCKVDTIKHPTRGFRMQQKFEPYALRSRAPGYTVS